MQIKPLKQHVRTGVFHVVFQNLPIQSRQIEMTLPILPIVNEEIRIEIEENDWKWFKVHTFSLNININKDPIYYIHLVKIS